VQREQRRLLDALHEPPADLIEQLILLPVDVAAGLVVCPPSLLALLFQLALDRSRTPSSLVLENALG
jgi:hypothetical protein